MCCSSFLRATWIQVDISVSSIQTLLSLLASWQEMKMAGQSQYKSPKTPGRIVSDAWSNFWRKEWFSSLLPSWPSSDLQRWRMLSLVTVPQITKKPSWQGRGWGPTGPLPPTSLLASVIGVLVCRWERDEHAWMGCGLHPYWLWELQLTHTPSKCLQICVFLSVFKICMFRSHAWKASVCISGCSTFLPSLGHIR